MVQGLGIQGSCSLLDLFLRRFFFTEIGSIGFFSWPLCLYLVPSDLNSHNVDLFLIHLEDWLLLDGWKLLLNLWPKVLAPLIKCAEIDVVATDPLGNRVVELSQLCVLDHRTDFQVFLPDQLEQSSKG